MKATFVILSMIFTFGLPFSVVAAQSAGAGTPEVDQIGTFDEVEGILSIYDRTFMMEMEASGTPEHDFTDANTADSFRMVSIEAITFDTNENALAYLDTLRVEVDKEIPRGEGLGDFVVTNLDDLGVEGFKMNTDMGDFDFGATITIFVDGNHAFLIMVTDADQPASEVLADDVTMFILDAEVENEEINFVGDGTSTGGVFDRLPTADDEIIGDLMDVMDTELYVRGD